MTRAFIPDIPKLERMLGFTEARREHPPTA